MRLRLLLAALTLAAAACGQRGFESRLIRDAGGERIADAAQVVRNQIAAIAVRSETNQICAALDRAQRVDQREHVGPRRTGGEVQTRAAGEPHERVAQELVTHRFPDRAAG